MIVVILQTYARTAYALATIRAMKQNMNYECRWLVVDDGSDAAHVAAVKAEIGPHLLGLYSARIGYGALANLAWLESERHGDVTLWLEDDWTLDADFDPAHYVARLRTDATLGMVRLGRIPVGLHGEVVGDGAECYMKLHKGKTQYYFSGNPSLRHIRFFQAYGDYPTGLKPGETELAYDRKIQANGGPDILIPFNIGTWGLFGHIGTEASYEP
jgi:hypothetical protein